MTTRLTQRIHQCKACHAPANVHVVDVRHARQVVQHYCLACADAPGIRLAPTGRRSAVAAALFVIGLFIFLNSLFADVLKFGCNEGFGWRQNAGLVVGVVLLGLGAAVRAPTLILCGLMIGSLTLVADWARFGVNDGFGPQQILGIALGAAIILAARITARSAG